MYYWLVNQIRSSLRILKKYHYNVTSARFPSRHFGTLYGISLSFSAAVVCLQYPIFQLMKSIGYGNKVYVSEIKIYIIE